MALDIGGLLAALAPGVLTLVLGLWLFWSGRIYTRGEIEAWRARAQRAERLYDQLRAREDARSKSTRESPPPSP
jgi:hypothetical protein